MADIKYDGPSEFVHLHLHTIYSKLDGVQTPEQVFSAAKDREWPAVAVTEHGNLASIPDNFFASRDTGVKYIVGCEIYFNDYEPKRQELAERGVKIRALKQTHPDAYARLVRNRHLTVLAKNATGVENLIKLTTQAYDTGFYYLPRVWFDKLLEYKEGLIVLSGCLNGPVAHELRCKNVRNDNGRGALDYIDKFREAFEDDYYIELQMPCIDELEDYKLFWCLNKIANEYGIQKVLTNDAHYLDRKDFQVQKLMMAIDQGTTIDDPELFHVNSDEQYFKSRAELYTTFKTNRYCEYVSDAEFEDMCNGTLMVAEKCDPFNPDTSSKVPSLGNAEQELREIVYAELKRRGLDEVDRKFIIDNREVTYKDQVEIELERFIEKDFASYFIITRDIIKFSNDNGWPIGPRGSVGGSLVCHLLGIHSLDPMKWQLSFDRFLSPARGGKILNIKAE